MTLIEFHGRLANTALFYIVIMAIWGLWKFFRRQSMDSSYWGALVIAEILLLVQASLGAYMLLSGVGNLAGQGMHILYGVVSVLVIPGVFFYTRGDQERRVLLLYGVFCLFLVGIILRAMDTVR